MDDQNAVEDLIKKAANSDKSEDAIRFSQAALNVAHARQVVVQTTNSARN